LNFDPHLFALDTSGFSPAYTGTFSVSTNANSLVVTYSPPLVPPALLAAQKLGSTGFQLSFSGPAGQPYRVLASVNPTTPVGNWTVLTNGVFGPDPVVFIDDNTNYPQRFYRIGSP
jgi:hypothetical protein